MTPLVILIVLAVASGLLVLSLRPRKTNTNENETTPGNGKALRVCAVVCMIIGWFCLFGSIYLAITQENIITLLYGIAALAGMYLIACFANALAFLVKRQKQIDRLLSLLENNSQTDESTIPQYNDNRSDNNRDSV